MGGGVVAEAGPQRAEASHPGRRVSGRGYRRGGLVGRFDHRDDDRVGASVEHSSDRRRVGIGQSHGGGDRHVLEAAQDVGDVGVVEVAVLGVETDVVVSGPGECFGPDRGRPGDPTAPHGFSAGKRLLQVTCCVIPHPTR